MVKVRIVEGTRRMSGIPAGDLEDDSSRLCGPVGRGEGKPIVSSSIVRLEMFRDGVDPGVVLAQIETVHSYKPVWGWDKFGHQ